MTLQGVNWLGVLVAILFTFISGAVWFGPKTFYPVWMKAMKIERVDQEGNSMAKVFGSLFVAIVIEVLVVALFVTSLQNSNSNIGILDGAIIGFWLGVGICAAPNLTHRLFAGHGFKVWIIENGNDIINMAVVGAIIAALN